MAQCIAADASGVLSISDASPCTTLIVLSPVEYAAIATSPLNLSAEDGATLSIAILAVWAAAWSWRQLVKVLAANDGGFE